MKINELPNLPGVYKFFDVESNVIYVGKALNLKRRVSSYFQKNTKDPKTQELVKNIARFEVIITKDEYSALILENELIKKFWPKFNIALKDDKNYPSIVTNKNHPFPRLEYHVGARNLDMDYFGPYTDRSAVKSILKELQKLFQIRSCKDSQFNQHKACLLYQIKRCSAPCENKISKLEYQKHYKEAIMFLSGDHKKLLEKWQKNMQKHSMNKEYEQAAFFRDLIKRCHKLSGKHENKTALDIVVLAKKANKMFIIWLWVRDSVLKGTQEFEVHNPILEDEKTVLQTVVVQMLTNMPSSYGRPDSIIVDLDDRLWGEVKIATKNKKIRKICPNKPEAQKWLQLAQQNLQLMLHKLDIKWAHVIFNDPEIQKIMPLKSPPNRTECFDISHTSGKQVYASCVVFDQNGPNKKLYRTYKVPFEDKPDDYNSLSYVFKTRYENITEIPDLIIVDGGKGQLSTVLKALENTVCSEVPVLAISKGPARKEGKELLHTRIAQDVSLSIYNQALYSLLFIRNESHRFALKQHRKSRERHAIKFKLESIPGIASKKRQALYNHFGGMDGLRKASIEQIVAVKGINHKLAKKILEFLQDC